MASGAATSQNHPGNERFLSVGMAEVQSGETTEGSVEATFC